MRRASRICVGACSAGDTTQSPRCASASSIPARFSAQRSPARASGAGLPSLWMPRTRTSVPAGESTSLSPVATAPLKTVPVATVPLPATPKTRSTAKRNPRPSCARSPSCFAESARRLRRASMPVPVVADTGSTSMPARRVGARRARTSAATSSTRCSVTRSALVITATPCVTDNRSTMFRCSMVCGITPSSAATTSTTKSIPQTPASMLRTNRSCPGTSTKPIVRPSSGVRQ